MTIYEFGDVLAEKRFLRRRHRFARNLSLALAELRSFGLVAPTARGLAIVPNAREALRLAEPRLRASPVREILLAAVYG